MILRLGINLHAASSPSGAQKRGTSMRQPRDHEPTAYARGGHLYPGSPRDHRVARAQTRRRCPGSIPGRRRTPAAIIFQPERLGQGVVSEALIGVGLRSPPKTSNELVKVRKPCSRIETPQLRQARGWSERWPPAVVFHRGGIDAAGAVSHCWRAVLSKATPSKALLVCRVARGVAAPGLSRIRACRCPVAGALRTSPSGEWTLASV